MTTRVPPSRSRAGQWLLRLSPLALLLPLTGLEPSYAGPGEPLDCEQALLVGGLLVCDDERPATIAQVCPSATAIELRGGDRIAGSCITAQVERMDPLDLAALEQDVDVNHADQAELASLPGIGPVLAEAIVAARPFASVDELDRVRGIGPRRLEQLRARARVIPAN